MVAGMRRRELGRAPLTCSTGRGCPQRRPRLRDLQGAHVRCDESRRPAVQLALPHRQRLPPQI